MTLKSLVAATLCLAGLAGTADAYTLYIDEAAYLGATGATAVPLPNIGNAGSSFSTGGLTFSSFGGATDLFSGTAGVEGTFGSDFVPALAGNDLAISGPENFAIDFATTATAFSLKIYEPTRDGPVSPTSGPVCNATCVESTFDISLYRDGLKLGGLLTVAPLNDAVTFVGLADLGGFDRIVVADLTGTIDNEFFGEFTVKMTPVPLPASLPLLLGGLLGVGLLRRRG